MPQDPSRHGTRVRRALLIGTDQFTDPGLTALCAPSSDVEALARVLGDPSIGGFALSMAVNTSAAELRVTMEDFFADSARDDLLLLYISTHGLKDIDGNLYFGATDTRMDRLHSTGVSAKFINELADSSRASGIIIILDACYSGAFARGMNPKADFSVDLVQRFEGRGRVVIASSGTMEYAFEGDSFRELASDSSDYTSAFTSAIVQGLETGDADRDQDGYVTTDELYEYVYARMRAAGVPQTPMRWSSARGSIVIASTAASVRDSWL